MGRIDVATERGCLRDARVLVTGGGSGIGKALGAAMAQDGARVVLADVDVDAATRAAAALTNTGSTASAIGLDVTDREGFARAVDTIVKDLGGIDYLVNCAGVSVGGPTHELSGPHWDTVIDVNLGGVVNGVLAAYPHMVEAGRGHIVNVASGAGLVALPFVVAYSAAKHGVVGLSLGLRPEAAVHGVRVSVVCPGAVETPILDRLPPPGLPATATVPITPRDYVSLLGQRPMDADVFARATVDRLSKNRAVIILPARLRSMWVMARLSPALTRGLARLLAARVRRKFLDPSAGHGSSHQDGNRGPS